MADERQGKSRFELIQGDWVSSPDWLAFPQTIHIRSPEDRGTFCRVRVSLGDILKAAGAHRRQPAYEFWSILNRSAPPVPHQESDPDAGLIGISDAHACFQGIKRPIAADNDGAAVLAYVLKPTFFYVYELRSPIVLTLKEPVPNDLVFMAYVRLDEPSLGSGVRGVLTHWQFVEADPADLRLPVNFRNRYTKRLW
ncbi:MAG TPA: hypothetical protein VHZ26_09095 [Caulobacteraceae bacterium]|nr:hypothetical protein [Caulobacteraceae bacterium]